MPSPPDGVPATRALDLLRGRPNPFESLVRPQRPDDRFSDLHVPALLRRPRELLLRLIDAYRLDEYRRASDLPDSRVVTVLGLRGAGKTHTVEALAHREDGRAQLLVRPAYFAPEVPFEEYLLSHVVTSLTAADGPFAAVATQLTRRLLRQAVRALGPTDRLFARAPSRRLRLLWGGGGAVSARFDRLAEALDGTRGKDLPALVREHGFAPEPLFRLVETHLDRHEGGRELLSAVRRQLYGAMARAALLGDGDALDRFLETDFAPTASRPASRVEVVRQRLHALVEACALVRLPVVFAFDNLEGFLAPQGRFDAAAARALMDSLAQAVDSLRGLLFFVFAESELYRQTRSNTNQFALDRLALGVPLRGEGPVDSVELRPPDFDELRQLIAERVGRLLKDFPVGELPAGFPFGQQFLDGLARKEEMGLRAKLLNLRDEYSRLVYGRGVEPVRGGRGPDWPALLERTWNEQLAAADRKLQGALAGRLQDLHVGLGRLLRQAGPVGVDGWRLADVQPTVSVGENASYGTLTLLTWKREEEGGEGGRAAVRLGVGLLLAGGTGMAKDLAAKFDLFRDTGLGADALVVLWPKVVDDDDMVSALPAATRKVWDGASRRRRAALRQLPTDDLRKMLAFPEWLEAVAAAAEQPPPEDVLRPFVSGKCQSVFRLVLPAVPEGVTAHAD
jgi:hypothetical protein